MSIQKGDKIPSATFMTPGADGPEPIDTNAIFSGLKAWTRLPAHPSMMFLLWAHGAKAKA